MKSKQQPRRGPDRVTERDDNAYDQCKNVGQQQNDGDKQHRPHQYSHCESHRVDLEQVVKCRGTFVHATVLTGPISRRLAE